MEIIIALQDLRRRLPQQTQDIEVPVRALAGVLAAVIRGDMEAMGPHYQLFLQKVNERYPGEDPLEVLDKARGECNDILSGRSVSRSVLLELLRIVKYLEEGGRLELAS